MKDRTGALHADKRTASSPPPPPWGGEGWGGGVPAVAPETRSGTVRAEPRDGAEFAAAVERAWAAGAAGWERLAAAWGTPAAPAPPTAARCWWDAAPWHGRIEPEEFRAIVAAYVAQY